VVGHVTAAKARSKGDSEASLGIVFDKIELSGGKDMPIKAWCRPSGPIRAQAPVPDTGVAGGNSLNAGTVQPQPQAPALARKQRNTRRREDARPTLDRVIGIKNLQLDNNSVLTSHRKEVKLDSGSQIMIKVEYQA